MKAAFYTLGCKVNQYETQILEQQFCDAGFELVSPAEGADLYIVNSCTVTSSGDKKTRQALRRFKRQSPGAVTVLTGCYPQAFPQDAAAILEADIVTGSKDRGGLLSIVRRYMDTRERIVTISPHTPGEPFESMHAAAFLERTRAFVKIEDGCDRYCSYCIIPTARGPIRSKAPEELARELEGLAASGYREVVLVGINLSSYGKESGGRFCLADAVELACGVPGIARVRLGSLEPELLTPGDIARMAAQPKFCPQFHLSLQSGCATTLARMNRHYTPAEYRALAAALRAAFQNCSLTTDVITGFPGETEEEFLESLAFVRELAFAKVHVFPYSARQGTRAAAMPNQVPKAVRDERAARLGRAAQEGRRAFLDSQVGRTEQVLFETTVTELGAEGYTKNYTPVRVLCEEVLSGQLRQVELTAVLGDACVGRLAASLPDLPI